MGNEGIALGDSLSPVPWHVRVNLGTEDTSSALSPEGRANSLEDMF